MTPPFNKIQLKSVGRCALVVLVVLVGALFITGCGKGESPSAKSPVVETSPAPEMISHEPVSSSRTLAVTPVITPTGEPDMSELNRCLLRWVMGNRRKPSSFEEFAASANVVIPPAPAGKKYVIDKSMHIVLVKQ